MFIGTHHKVLPFWLKSLFWWQGGRGGGFFTECGILKNDEMFLIILLNTNACLNGCLHLLERTTWATYSSRYDSRFHQSLSRCEGNYVHNVHVTANVIHIMKRKYMGLHWLEFLCECSTRYLSSEILSRKLLEKFHIYTSSCRILNFVYYIKLRGLYCMKKALDWEWLMHCHHSSTWQSGIKDKWCVSSWLGI